MDEIRIGEIDAIHGPEAAFGVAANQGIAFAIEEINLAGGIHGRKLKLILIDDQGKAEESVVAAKKLIGIHKVIAIVTGATSSRCMAMAPVLQASGVPLLATAATHPKLTQQGDFIFRVSFIDPFQGSSMALFAKNSLGLKKVALLSDVKSDYSMGLSEAFKKKFLQIGGELAGVQYYSSGDIDFKGQLTSLREKKPEAIFVPGYYGDVGLIARQASGLGIKIPLLGGDGWDSPKLIEIGGRSIVGSFFSGFYSPRDKSGRVQEFVQKFKNRLGFMPDAAAALGYEGMSVLIEAIRSQANLQTKNETKFQAPTGAKIKEGLARIKNFSALGGKLSIDKSRNAIRPVVIMRISEESQFEYQTSVFPEDETVDRPAE